MIDFIRVQPERPKRVAFARWAVAQQPKVRTVSAEAFAVPPRLFTDMPEDLLRGALVDGRAYVSPADTEPAEPGAAELLGVATRGPDGFLEAVAGQPLPEVPASWYVPDAVPLPDSSTPLEDAPGDPDADAAAMVAATSPEMVERAMTAVLIATDLAASNAARGDTAGDTPGDVLAQGGDTAGETPAVTSEDTPGDTGDTAGDTGGDTGRSFPCGACPRAFKSERGRDSHRRQVHGR
ncbi:hypothetical protein [Streptomyces olivaceus]|uniref:hypothetical protein n=1 Tax=Streptomyces olivaceus TaxID=47716 RepID=UPI003636AE85